MEWGFSSPPLHTTNTNSNFPFLPPINVTGKKRFPFLFHVLDTKVKGFPFILYSKTESLGPQL